MTKRPQNCSNVDAFGYPISLLYQGSARYTTKLGAFLTVLLSLIFLFYLSLRSVTAIQQEERVSVKTSEKVLRFVDSQSFRINNFDVMAGFFQDGLPIQLSPKIGRLEAIRYQKQD